MSDIPTAFFVLLSIFLMKRKKSLVLGFVLGFLLLLRYSNFLIVLSLLSIYLLRKEWKDFLKSSIGTIFFGLSFLLYIFLTFGNIGGLIRAASTSFGLIHFPGKFSYYLISLNVLYPGLLLIGMVNGFLKWKKYSIFVLPSIVLLFFYSFYYYVDIGRNFIETIITGQRFMLPVVPLLMVPYIDFLSNRNLSRKLVAASMFPLFLLCAFLQIEHTKFLKREKAVKDLVYSMTEDADLILCNGQAEEIFNPFFGRRKWENLEKTIGILSSRDLLKNYRNIYFVYVESGVTPRRSQEERRFFIENAKALGKVRKVYESERPFHILIYTLVEEESSLFWKGNKLKRF